MVVDEKDLSPEDVELKEKENKNKVANAFNENVKKIEALLGKPADKKTRRKVPSGAMEAIIADLFKEEDEDLQKNMRADLKKLLLSYVELHQALDTKRKEMEQLENAKMKEFNEAAQKLFNRIDGFPEILKKYAAGLKAAVSSTEGK